jgi:hypothetical protein
VFVDSLKAFKLSLFLMTQFRWENLSIVKYHVLLTLYIKWKKIKSSFKKDVVSLIAARRKKIYISLCYHIKNIFVLKYFFVLFWMKYFYKWWIFVMITAGNYVLTFKVAWLEIYYYKKDIEHKVENFMDIFHCNLWLDT